MQAHSGNLHEIVIEDPAYLSGASVLSFVRRIIDHFEIGWVHLNDIDGAVSGLRARDGELMPSAEFLGLVDQATQYDWAFFFMYRKNPPHPALLEMGDKERMRGADITVRLVDDEYFYVYSGNEDMTRAVRNWHPAAAHRLVEIENLIVPY